MTPVHLQQWIQHPEALNRDTLYELRTLVARYPYFQSLRLLYLKNLYLLHDINFGAELRKAVLYVSDRRVLFYLIEGDRYVLQSHTILHADGNEPDKEPTLDRTLSLIDAFLATVPEEHSQATELDYSMDYTSFLMQADDEAEETDRVSSTPAEVPKLRGQHLIDGFIRQSETEEGICLRLTKDEELPPLPPEAEETVETVAENVEVDSIDTEVYSENAEADSENAEVNTETLEADSESIDAVSEVLEDLSEEIDVHSEDSDADDYAPPKMVSDELDDSCFTETLAKIYIKQRRYDKALEIIKKLSLNYPKKNAYFADQIRFLEKLIINAKSK